MATNKPAVVRTILIAVLALAASVPLGAIEPDGYTFPPEWAPQERVWIAWVPASATEFQSAERTAAQLALRASVIEHLSASSDVSVLTVPAARAEAEEAIAAAGADMDRVDFYEHETLDWFFRDAGPRFLSNGRELKIADFGWSCYGYTYPLATPDCFARGDIDNHIASDLGIEVTGSPVVIEGGAIDVASDLLMAYRDTLQKRNPALAIEEIERELLRVYGKKKVIWLDRSPYGDRALHKVGPYFGWGANGHIDEFARFVDDRTVLVAQIREADADNPLSRADRTILLENKRQLLAATGSDGRPLRVIEMPVPDIDLFVEEWVVAPWMDDAFPGVFRHYREGEKIFWTPAVSYMNFVIANHAILLPAYWSEGLPESVRADDERARAILAEAFPDRTIIQIDPLAINWLGGGMHCATQQQPRVAR